MYWLPEPENNIDLLHIQKIRSSTKRFGCVFFFWFFLTEICAFEDLHYKFLTLPLPLHGNPKPSLIFFGNKKFHGFYYDP